MFQLSNYNQLPITMNYNNSELGRVVQCVNALDPESESSRFKLLGNQSR